MPKNIRHLTYFYTADARSNTANQHHNEDCIPGLLFDCYFNCCAVRSIPIILDGQNGDRANALLFGHFQDPLMTYRIRWRD